MKTVNQYLSNGNVTNYFSIESLVKSLVFLFPIGTALIPHWESTFFTLLFLISLYFYLSKHKQNILKLQKSEKIILWSMVLYFFMFVFTSLINTEWGHSQNRALGVEIRYLLFVPMYLMIRQIQGSTEFLLKGMVVAGVLLGIVALYEVFVLGKPAADADYFMLYFGSISVLFFVFIIFSNFLENQQPVWRALAVVSSLLLVTAIMLSTARMAYLSFVVCVFLWLFLFVKGKKLLVLITAMVLLLFTMYLSFEGFKDEIDRSVTNFSNYFGQNQVLFERASNTNIGERFEMWRASYYIFLENPVFGVGRGGFNSSAQQYVDNGSVSSKVLLYSHPHNAYIEALVSRGSVGLLVFLAVLYFPLRVFISQYNSVSSISMIGIGFLLCISVLSFTESMMFLRGKFLSVFLVCLMCLLSSIFVNSETGVYSCSKPD